MKRFFRRFSTYSNTWQTSLMIMFIVIISVGLSIWFFWRSLYLPELKNHAHYLTTQINLLQQIRNDWHDKPKVQDWMFQHFPLVLVSDATKFPEVEDKFIAGTFTQVIEKEISAQLQRPVTVYFKFTPTAQLWIQDSKFPNIWLREPVIYYSQYSPTILLSFILGLPILTLATIILLTRQLNRPLRRLQRAANDYIKHGYATTLPTRVSSIEIRQVNIAFNRLFTTLNQAQKERSIMLAGISHDLRTPLTRMRLTAEMLSDDFLREGLVYDIEDMDAILEQFISFMKDGSDEAVRLTNLDNIFNEIIIQFAPIKFIYHPKHLSEIPLRPLSIKRLIINLVNNAHRYGKPPIYLSATIIDNKQFLQQHPEMTINPDPDNIEEQKLEQSTKISWFIQAKNILKLSVRDCGNGIANDQLERIMQPFERGETARTTQGSGLGLAIVDRITKLHHGIVKTQNHPDGGFEVCVYIPLLSQVISNDTI